MFPRGTNRPKKTLLLAKCSDEARLSFDAALVSSEGARLDLLELTVKKAVLLSHCEKLFKEEAKRAKTLAGNCLPWATS